MSARHLGTGLRVGDGHHAPVTVRRVDERLAATATSERAPPAIVLHCRVIDDDASFAALASAWRALEALDPECSPFDTFRWNAAWWARHGRAGELRVVVVQAAGRVVGIAPFHLAREIEHRVLRRTVLRLVGSGGDASPGYRGMACEPALRREIVGCALDAVFWMPEWHTLGLCGVRAGSPLDVLTGRWLQRARGTARPALVRRVPVSAPTDARGASPTKPRREILVRDHTFHRPGPSAWLAGLRRRLGAPAGADVGPTAHPPPANEREPE